jgi:hypothetical protein
MPKLFHVVTKDHTTTFTTKEERDDCLSDIPVQVLTDDTILCESDVTGEEYDRYCRWRGEL